MKKQIKNKYTFKPPIIDKTHWVLGDAHLPAVIVLPSGDWTDFLPTPELQSRRGIETYDCTGFNTLNPIEILMFKLFGEKVNYSDRWLGIVAGTKEGGNDPHSVAEAIKKYGLIPEEMLPFSDDITSIDEYYSFKGADEEACRAEGKKWLEKYNFNHDWVFSMSQPLEEKINNIKVALKSSPLGISVFAWQKDNRGVYISVDSPNHWTCAYSQAEFTSVFDSYDPFLKLVDQDILYCKRYVISKKVEDIQIQINWIQKALALLQLAVANFIANLKPKSVSQVITSKPVAQTPISPEVAPVVTKYEWDTPEKARYSFRVICDEVGLSVPDKNKLCQVLNCESGFKIGIVHPNKDARKTTDFGVAEVDTQKLGIAQFNDYWYKNLISPEDALNNPEKACRVFISQFQKGHLKDWVCYSSGMYENFKP